MWVEKYRILNREIGYLDREIGSLDREIASLDREISGIEKYKRAKISGWRN